MTTTTDRRAKATRKLVEVYTDGEAATGARAIHSVADASDTWAVVFNGVHDLTAGMHRVVGAALREFEYPGEEVAVDLDDTTGNRGAWLAEFHTMSSAEFSTRMREKIANITEDLMTDVIREYLIDSGAMPAPAPTARQLQAQGYAVAAPEAGER